MVPIDPNVKFREQVESAAAVGRQPATKEMNTDRKRDVGRNAKNDQTSTRTLVQNPVFERDGGASDQQEQN